MRGGHAPPTTYHLPLTTHHVPAGEDENGVLLPWTMDLHHKLRRNPNWHPDSCNICGQLGHQAATCCNGTVDFKAIYGGPGAFIKQPPVYPSDVYAIQMKKKVLSLDALDRDVERWRANRENSNMEHSKHIAGMRGAAQPGKRRAAPSRVLVEAPDLPEGWAAAKDGSGKVYYFHKTTKQVQWNRPEAGA